MAKRKTPAKSQRPARKATPAASRKAKSTSASKTTASKKTKAKTTTGDAEVKVDRRRGSRRKAEEGADATSRPATAPAGLERRKKVNRRRQIDPTTCERDYTDDEISFMNALDDYKRRNGRMFPTCSEILEVVGSLGYVKLSPSELAARAAAAPPMPNEECGSLPTFIPDTELAQ